MSAVKVAIEAAIDADAEADGRSTNNNGAADAGADKVPVAGDPVAVIHVAGDPDVSGAWAGRNVSDRSAHVKSELGCLRRYCAKARRAHCHCCT